MHSCGVDKAESSIDFKESALEWYPVEIEEYAESSWHNDGLNELLEKVKDFSIQENKQDEEIFFTDRKFGDELIKVTKMTELENWKNNNMFDEVRYTGQKCVSHIGVYRKNHWR